MKIFVQKQDSKFINNIILTLRYMEETVLSTDINKDLYKIYHHYPFDIAIFLSSKFDNEIAQFITEMYSKNVKFFIYHDELNTDILRDFNKAAVHLSHTNHETAINLPDMINNHLYKKSDLHRKKSSYAVFLDHTNNIPDEIIDILYPNTKLHINMFNSEYVSHPQNLGLITEIEKAKILNEYEFFIDINNNYSAEALACGSKVITVEQIKNNKKPKTQKKKTIDTYENFIRTHLI